VFPLGLFMTVMLTTCATVVKEKKYVHLLSEMLQIQFILPPITEITDTQVAEMILIQMFSML